MIYFIIITLNTLGQVASDLYVPSMPAIASALAATPAMIKLTLSVFMLGYGASMLLYGPIADRFGRKKPLLFGVGLMVTGSIICAVAGSAYILILGRLIQGIGAGACGVARAIIRDLFDGVHLARLGSYLGVIGAMVISSAPTLGGYLQHYWDWQACFIFLFIYSIIIFAFVAFLLPETHQHFNPHATKLRVLVKNYFTLLSNKVFVCYNICICCVYAGLMGYFTAAPFLFQNILKFTPVQFGWVSFASGGAVLIAGVTNGRVVVKTGIPKMLKIGAYFLLTGSLVMMGAKLLGFINAYVIIIPVIIFSLGCGFTFANASAGAISPFPKMAGSAGALFTCLQILTASLASAVMAEFHEKNQLSIAILFIIVSVIGLMAALIVQPKSSLAQEV